MRVKSSGVAPVLANARPPGSAKFANAPPPLPGLTRRANAAGGEGAQLELTDACTCEIFVCICTLNG